MTYLAVIDLNNGTAHRRSERAELARGIVTSLRPALTDAEGGAPTDLDLDGQTWALWRCDRANGGRHTRQWSLGPSPDHAVLTISLAMKSGPGAGLWRHIHRTAVGLATDTDSRPPAPWMAIQRHGLGAGEAEGDRMLDCLDGRLQAVAWAWIESCYG